MVTATKTGAAGTKTGAAGTAGAAGKTVTARDVAETVTDPELPMLTLADLGVLREVTEAADGVTVSITPTYTGCPAMDTMRDDLVHALEQAGFRSVEVRTVLDSPWSTDWITDRGRERLAEAGIAPPGAAPQRGDGPVPVQLLPPRRAVSCPHCGADDTEPVSEFGPTACKALRRCPACAEPFEHVKEI